MQALLFSTFSHPFIGLATGTVVMLCMNFFLFTALMAFYLREKCLDRKIAAKAELDARIAEARSQELEWYREKRFLMESQAREKQSRLAVLVNSIAPENTHRMTYSASRLFFLAESIREERQHLGTDISKLSLIERRLRTLGKECVKQSGKGAQTEAWLSRMSLCRQMIQGNREDLRKSQNLLRNVLGEIAHLEERSRQNNIPDSDMPGVIRELEDAKTKISELPDGLRTVAKSTGEQAQALFKESTRHIPEEDLHEVWKEQTTLDLFSSKHRPGGRSYLLESAEAALSALRSSCLREDGFAAFLDSVPEKEFTSPGTELFAAEPGEAVGALIKEGKENRFGKPSPQSVPKENTVDKGKRVEPEEAGRSGIEGKNREKADSGAPNSGSNFRQPKPGEGFSSPAPVNKPPKDEIPFGSPPVKEGKEVESEEAVWAAPLNADLEAASKGKKNNLFESFTPDTSLRKKSGMDTSNLVIFRSDNPEIWNSTTNDGGNRTSIAISEISGDVNWMGIKRLDTGEEVFSEVVLDELKKSGEGKSAGFNGSNEYFYGARHLGFFSEECAGDVETRFTYGGWGFGHLSTSEDDTIGQICGWNGQRIPNGTVFEFTLYEAKPERVRDDQIVAG